MKATFAEYEVSILAYCLMPNHYHFLLRQESERPVSNWIRRLFNGYVQAVNKQQGRSGTLFESRAKHVLVADDAYAMHLTRYIHLNPVRAGLTSKAADWVFSNYREWIGERAGCLFNQGFMTSYFKTPSEYREFVECHAADLEQKYIQHYLHP